MHLLFYGGTQVKLLHNRSVETVLKDLSVRVRMLHPYVFYHTLIVLCQQGKIYDSPESVKSIPSFIETYGISVDELEQPDITKYACFNDFFYRCVFPAFASSIHILTSCRKLRSDVRPVQNAADISGFCSAADCRLTVYPSVDLAKQFWYVDTPRRINGQRPLMLYLVC